MTSQWPDGVHGDRFLTTLFPDLASEFEVDLHEVRLHREGSVLRLTFDMPAAPKAMPAKWQKMGYNTVQVRLMAVGIQDIVFRGWASEIKGRLMLSLDSGGAGLVFHSNCVSVDARAETLHVDHVTAYAREPTIQS